MRAPYGCYRYFNKINTKWKPFELRREKDRISAICPGCISHRKIVGERRGNLLFERYCQKRSQAAYKLYWRSHPEEYKALMESFKK